MQSDRRLVLENRRKQAFVRVSKAKAKHTCDKCRFEAFSYIHTIKGKQAEL